MKESENFLFSLALQPPWALTFDFFQFHDRFTDRRTPWTSDQLVARPLPTHTTQTQNKHIYIPNIHALCEIRTHDPGFKANEDSTCLRPLGYRDRQSEKLSSYKAVIFLFVVMCRPLEHPSLYPFIAPNFAKNKVH
jgi:hypothetical protein